MKRSGLASPHDRLQFSQITAEYPVKFPDIGWVIITDETEELAEDTEAMVAAVKKLQTAERARVARWRYQDVKDAATIVQRVYRAYHPPTRGQFAMFGGVHDPADPDNFAAAGRWDRRGLADGMGHHELEWLE